MVSNKEIENAKAILRKNGIKFYEARREFDHKGIDACDYEDQAKNCLNKALNEVLGFKASRIEVSTNGNKITLEAHFKKNDQYEASHVKGSVDKKLDECYADELTLRLPKECMVAFKGMDISHKTGMEFTTFEVEFF